MEGGGAGGRGDRDPAAPLCTIAGTGPAWVPHREASADNRSRGGWDRTLQQAKLLSSPTVGAMSQDALGGGPPTGWIPKQGCVLSGS